MKIWIAVVWNSWKKEVVARREFTTLAEANKFRADFNKEISLQFTCSVLEREREYSIWTKSKEQTKS